MWSVSRPVCVADLELNTPVRALHSLRESDADAVAAALPLFGPEWELQRHESDDGNLVLVLSPEESERGFALHRTVAGVGLIALHDDGHAAVGVFDSVAAAVWQAQRILADAQEQASIAA